MSPSSVSRSHYKLLIQLVVVWVCFLGLAQKNFAATGCNTASFNSAPTFAAGSNPVSSATADLNGDGALDLVVTNLTADTFSILFGDGAGGFAPPFTYPVGINTPVGAYPNAVAIGDMNADGKLDLVVVGGYANGWVSVLLGDGAGNFGAPLNQPTGSGALVGVVLGDFNGDGNKDVVVTGASSRKVTFLLGNGSGGFTSMPSVSVTSDATAIATGDFNGDGLPDVIVTGTYFEDKLFVIWGSKTGTFALNQSITTRSQPQAIAVADFNGDGKSDVAMAFNWADSGVEIRLGDGSGTFPVVSSTIATEYAPTAIAVTDVNNDSHLDILVDISGASAVGVFPGLGTGQFSSPQYFGTMPGAALSMVAADFNNDGKKDVVTTHQNAGAVTVLLGDGAGALSGPRVMVEPNQRGGVLATADFNGDGRADIAIPQAYANYVLIYPTDSSGNPSPPTFWPISTPAISVATGDFNHDGKPDLVFGHDLSSGPSFVTVLLNNGSGGFSGPTDFNVGGTGNLPSNEIVIGNFDGDSNPDLAVLLGTFANSTRIAILHGNGSGGFSSPSYITSNDWAIWIGTGDFNGDGKQDLALANFNPSNITILLGDGTGAFTASPTQISIPNKVNHLLVTDLNKDGRPDFVTTHTDINQVGVFVNNGSGFDSQGFVAPFVAPSTTSETVAAGDFNGDGNPDLAFSAGNPQGNIAIMTGDGLANFAPPVYVTASGATPDIAVADFNSDGRADLAAPNYPVILLNTFTPLPCLSINDVSVPEGDSGTTSADFTVSLSTSSLQTVRVNYSVVGVTATAGADYLPLSGRLAFAPGEISKPISVPIKVDVLNESDETFKLLLVSPAAAGMADGEGLGTILDNDPLPSLRINDISVAEGGPSNLRNFTVTLSAPSGRAVTVQYATANGTATSGTQAAGDDYFNTTGTLTIPAGQTAANIGVIVFGDSTFEPDETFFLNLSYPTNATIDDGQGMATIINDDPVPSLMIQDAVVTEGDSGTQNAQFQVMLSNGTYLPVTFNFATTDETARAGSDYVATSGTATIDPQQISKIISVPIIGDTVDETSEIFYLDLTNVQNAGVTRSRATGFIIDDDGPTISVNDVAVLEKNSGTSNATFTLTLSAASVENVTVRVSTSSGTATANSDYLAFVSNVTIPAGTLTRTFIVVINGDTTSEPDETFFVNLTQPVNGAIARAQGKGIIINDDAGSGNTIDLAGFFVRQNYVDFLNREPDVAGYEFWNGQITSCGSDAQCIDVKRINVSAAFFLSIEFQQTGYLVERFYKVAYGDASGTSTLGGPHQLAVPIVRFNEFLKDTQRIGQGVVVLAPGWEQALENNKQAYAGEFVATSRFSTAFLVTMTPAQFVDQLNQNAGNVLSAGERTTAINLFGSAADSSNTTARAQAVRQVAENTTLYNAEFNRAFVLAQYFGYLRRNPNDPPDADYTGYEFWLNKLNQFNGDYIAAEMVKAFISSGEYRQRFGP